MQMLESAEPGSHEEEVGLFFAELVRGEEWFDEFLNDFGAKHPDKKVKEFLDKVTASPPPWQQGGPETQGPGIKHVQ